MRFVVSFVAIVIIILGFFLFGREETYTNVPSSGSTIIAFGDSLVSGVGATAGNDFVSVLSERIGEPIINLGVSGDTTGRALERIGEVTSRDPNVVIVLLGGNDFLNRIPKEETFNNLAQIIKQIHGAGGATLLLGVQGGILRDSFKGEYKKLAEMYNTAYVPDILDGLITHPEFMYDAIHPNDKGYAQMADNIEPVLRKLLR